MRRSRSECEAAEFREKLRACVKHRPRPTAAVCEIVGCTPPTARALLSLRPMRVRREYIARAHEALPRVFAAAPASPAGEGTEALTRRWRRARCDAARRGVAWQIAAYMTEVARQERSDATVQTRVIFLGAKVPTKVCCDLLAFGKRTFTIVVELETLRLSLYDAQGDPKYGGPLHNTPLRTLLRYNKE